jgi:hypothetical protein
MSPATAPERVTARIPQAVRAKASVKAKRENGFETMRANASCAAKGCEGNQQHAIARVAICRSRSSRAILAARLSVKAS